MPIREWAWGPATPIRVLDPKVTLAGKERGVKEGRVWVHVRDDRPWAGQDPPAAAYWLSPDRKGEHPQTPLRNVAGILQADAHAGFRKLYERGLDGEPRLREAAGWAHLRRDFHDIWKSTDPPIARDALEQIGKLYDVERAIRPMAVGRKTLAQLALAMQSGCPTGVSPATEASTGRGVGSLGRIVR